MKKLVAILVAPLAIVALFTALGDLAPDSRAPEPRELRWRYIHSGAFGHFDHELYYYNLFGVMDSVRQADVVFLGTSRTLFALEPGLLAEQTARTGARFHALAFPFRESMRFPLRLIEKYDIRNKNFVVEADDAFFADPVGAYAASVMTRGAFSSLARIHYNTAKYRALTLLDGLPGLGSALEPSRTLLYSDKVLYRSEAMGTWFAGYFPLQETRLAVSEGGAGAGPARFGGRGVLDGARELVRTLQARGGRVFFLRIPYPGSPAQAQVRELAVQAGAEFLDIPLSEVTLRDGEHLTTDSARACTEALMVSLRAAGAFDEK